MDDNETIQKIIIACFFSIFFLIGWIANASVNTFLVHEDEVLKHPPRLWFLGMLIHFTIMLIEIRNLCK
jgi:hypothetical protein